MPGSIWTLLMGLASGARLTVDGDGGGDYETLQDALDEALPGDFVVLEPGVYEGATISGEPIPILGREGPASTWIDSSGSFGVWMNTGGRLRLEGLAISASNSAVYSQSGGIHARRVWALGGVYGFYGYNAEDWLLEACLAEDASTYGVYLQYTDAVLDQLTLLGNPTHLYVRSNSVTAEGLIGWGGIPISGCSGASVSLSDALFGDYSGTTWPSCVSATRTLLGYDPEFLDYSDDGDWGNDDLGLSTGSPAEDAGSCLDVDGSPCDLGLYGGAWGSDQDSDLDGQPDAWEDEHGLDPSTAEGSDDLDGDGLENLGEYLYDTHPGLADTDSDGVDDLDEIEAGFDPDDDTDQRPTAVVTGGTYGYVDEPVTLGQASTDPMSQPLLRTWTLTDQPTGGSLPTSLGSGTTATFLPDRAGTYEVQLEVDDGTWTDTSTLQVRVFEDQVVRIPDDFETLAEVVDALTPGMIVAFGPGEHEITSLGSVSRPLTLVGSGRELTTLVHDGYVVVNSQLRMQDLALESRGTLAISAGTGSTLELSGVRVQASTTAVQAQGLVIAWDSWFEGGSGYGLQLSGGIGWLRKVQLSGSTALRSSSRVDLRGGLLEGSAYGLQQTSGDLRMQHATLRAANAGLYATSGQLSRLDHLVVEDAAEALRCPGQQTVDFLGLVSAGAVANCSVIRQATEIQPLGSDGVPRLESAWWDGGDWREQDPDGTTWDLGFTGGPWGYRVEHGLEEPWVDRDGDGLSAVTEWMLGSDDGLQDSDGDGVVDSTELRRFSDPSDPRDQLPEVLHGDLRTSAGVEVELLLETATAADCDFLWDSGEEGGSKLFTPTEPGATEHGWAMTCGEGQLRGSSFVLAELRRSVPSEVGLDQALLELEDHHVLVLEDGDHLGDVDLRGSRALVQGSGPDTRLLGDVQLDQASSGLANLVVEGTVHAADGSLGPLQAERLWVGSASGRNLLVLGDMDVLDDAPTFANLTVDGDLRMRGAGFRSSVWTGTYSGPQGLTTSYIYGSGASPLGSQPFIRWEHDEDDVLQPWPGSPLWDAGSSTESNRDLDGSREDVGYTGGPQAWPTDEDGDLLNDAWEQLHGIPTPGTDSDEDGLDELQEFTAGTDPWDPDTDGDRIADGLDPLPLVPEGDGLRLELAIDDRFPWPEQPVTVSAAGLRDPLGELTLSYTLHTPPGSEAELVDGRFTPDLAGVYLVGLEIETVDGLLYELEEPVYARASHTVPAGADLQEALDLAPVGSELLLEGSYEGSFVIERDVVLRHATGARGGVLSTTFEGEPVLTIAQGARARLEDLTMTPGSGGGVLVLGTAELRRLRILGGETSLRVQGGRVEGSSLVALDPSMLLVASDGVVSLTNSVLGYTDSTEPLPAISMERSSLVLQDSVLDWPTEGVPLLSCLSACELLFEDLLVEDEAVLESLASGLLVNPIVGDPGFLVHPLDSLKEGAADLRLGEGSAAVDAGVAEGQDADGSRADIGAHGGLHGNWPDVDEDRDGHNELEGDCDDDDPQVYPDLLTGRCPAPDRCAGCASGPGVTWPLALLLIGTALTRRRREQTG
jgi:uncharacterized protein (TIGR03382 family)